MVMPPVWKGEKSIDSGICPCLMLLSVERSIFILSVICTKLNACILPVSKYFHFFFCTIKTVKSNALNISLLKGSL